MIAYLEAGHLCPNCVHNPHKLVSWHLGIERLTPLRADLMKIGVADTYVILSKRRTSEEALHTPQKVIPKLTSFAPTACLREGCLRLTTVQSRQQTELSKHSPEHSRWRKTEHGAESVVFRSQEGF